MKLKPNTHTAIGLIIMLAVILSASMGEGDNSTIWLSCAAPAMAIAGILLERGKNNE